LAAAETAPGALVAAAGTSDSMADAATVAAGVFTAVALVLPFCTPADFGFLGAARSSARSIVTAEFLRRYSRSIFAIASGAIQVTSLKLNPQLEELPPWQLSRDEKLDRRARSLRTRRC
jgi:hypothetical protein